MSKSDSLISDLTAEQKTAVTVGKGPLLIVAGAGTGKTKVLTTRIAWLIQKKIARPEEVLALTFTEKAAREMSERVDELLPLGTNTATITTFHSFTTDVLRTHAHLLAIPADFSLLTKEEELVLLREQIFNLPLKKLRPGSNPTKFLMALQSFFNRLQDEAISSDDLDQIARQYLKSSDEALRDEGNILTELAAGFAAYEQILHEQGYLTFGHCITETLRLLREHPSVKKELRSRYHYLLVDEYQDTNWAQTELSAVLAGQAGNLTVVGDDDQAIYSFRGAASANLLDFKKRFPKSKQVVLTTNFRSHQAILDAAYRMIQHNNPDRLEYQNKINKRLKSQDQGGVADFQLFDRLSSELTAISQQVNAWLSQGVEPTEIAVLTRTRSQAGTVAQTLINSGINVSSQLEARLTEHSLTKGALAFLKLIIEPTDNLAFYNTLFNPPFALDPDILNRLISQRPYKEDTYFDYAKKLLDFPPAWLDAKNQRRLSKLFKIYQQLSDLTSFRPSVGLLKFLHESGLYQKLTKDSNGQHDYDLERLGELFEIMQDYEERHRHPNLSEFINYLDIIEENGLGGPSSVYESDPFAVNVMTVHQSKGLEFTAVIVAHCVMGRFPSREQQDPFTIPKELIKESKPSGDQHLAEERRLFYVALTRAKKEVLVTAAKRYGSSNRQARLAPFVSESFGPDVLAKKPHRSSASQYLQTKLELPEQSDPIPKKLTPAKFITISHTDLDTYIKCPWQYRYKSILKVKVYPSAALSFGISMHNTLRAYFDRRRQGQSPDLVSLLAEYWVSGGFESRQQENERRQEGQTALAKLAPSLESVQPDFLEWSFNIPLNSGDRLRGRIDRLDRGREGWSIVDYKTGQAKTVAQAKQDLQLGMYILAVEKAMPQKVEQVTLYYLMSNQTVTVKRSEFALEKTKNKIDHALDNLKNDSSNDSFTATPDKMICAYCDYKKICPFRYTN